MCELMLCLLPVPTGSPLQFYVDAINSGHVTAYGPGLSHGMVNKSAIFTIVTKDAGEGGEISHVLLAYSKHNMTQQPVSY